MTGPKIRALTEGELAMGYTQLTNALILGEGARRLSDAGFRLGVIALARVGELGTREAELSYSFIRTCTGASDDRIKRMKRDLVAGLPHVFSIIPGDRLNNEGDGIRINLRALSSEHVAFLNRKEEQKAERYHRDVETVFCLAGEPTPEVGVPLPRNSGYPLPETRGTPTPESGEKKELKEQEDKKTSMSATADGLEGVEQQAKTGNKSSDRQISSAVKAPTVQQLMPFLAIWNENRNPDRMSQHRGLDRDQTALLQQMVAGHGGDVNAALASWELAVKKLAAVDTRQATNWWGDPSQPKRGLANAARHWSKHAVEHAAIPAVKAQPEKFDDFELDDEEVI